VEDGPSRFLDEIGEVKQTTIDPFGGDDLAY
jgi:hypothetical protein